MKTVSFDYMVEDGTFNLRLYCENNSYYGEFAFDKHGKVAAYDGVTVEDLGNGYYHVEFTIKDLTRYKGNTNADIVKLYIYGLWSDAAGEIKNLEFAQPAPDKATIDFADKANRTNFTTSQQVWEQNGIVITNNKAASTSNVADYADPARFYKSSELIIEYTGMTKIVFEMGTYSDKDYPQDLMNSLAGIDGITVTRDGLFVTIEFNAPVNQLHIASLTNQIRVKNITIYA